MAAQPNSGQVFQYVADTHGYLEEEGVDVEMVYINNASDAFQALVGGQINVMSTYGTGGPLIQISQGQNFTIFGGYMIIGETPCFGLPETESISCWKAAVCILGRSSECWWPGSSART